MSYWKKTSGKNYQSLDNYSSKTNVDVGNNEFYEFEPAIVLDVVLDETHEIFKNKELTRIDFDRIPSDVSGEKPLKNDIDYSWIGRSLIRLVETQKSVEKEQLVWAYPLESNISEYPLINEIVIAVKYFGQTFYTRKLNYLNFPNSNQKFGLEQLFGGFLDGTQKGNRELNEPNKEFQGPISKGRHSGGYGFDGVVGRYFWINKNIRSIKRFEGDLTFESRFGQSLRFSAYDNNRKNDIGLEEYEDYHAKINNPYTKFHSGGGNPMIILRNRQRPI